MANQCPEEEHRQSRSGIDANPLAGNAQPHKQAAEGKVRQQCLHILHGNIPLHKPQHEKVTPQNEEHREAVNGSNAGLSEVHAVQCHHAHGSKGHVRAFGQLLPQQIHSRQHQYACQCTGKAPSEGSHAEDGHRPAHDHLAKGRMGGFIRNRAVQVFKGSPCVIDLIKIGTVVPARFSFQGILLIQQCLRICQQRRIFISICSGGNRGGQHIAIQIPKDHFIQNQPHLLCRESHIPSAQHRADAAVEGLHAAVFRIVTYVLPTEALAFIHLGIVFL